MPQRVSSEMPQTDLWDGCQCPCALGARAPYFALMIQ